MQESITKKRKIKFEKDISKGVLGEIKNHLEKIKGVMEVEIYSRASLINLKYNLREVSFKEIEKKIVELGFLLSEKWTDKFRRDFVKFKEQNEMDHLTAKPSPCCSDPGMR